MVQETCSMCGQLCRTADMWKVHVLVGDGFELEEFIVCDSCYSKLTEVICKSCAQFYYVAKEMLEEDGEVKRMVKSVLCPRCYAKQGQ